jgi:hypothetical protein
MVMMQTQQSTNDRARGETEQYSSVLRLVIMWEFYQVGQGNQERNEQKLLERQVMYRASPRDVDVDLWRES